MKNQNQEQDVNQAVALQEPPEPGLFARHAVAIQQAVNELHEHILSFYGLIEAAGEKVGDRDRSSLQDIFSELLTSIALRSIDALLTGRLRLSDEEYRAAQTKQAETGDYLPVERLGAFLGRGDELDLLPPVARASLVQVMRVVDVMTDLDQAAEAADQDTAGTLSSASKKLQEGIDELMADFVFYRLDPTHRGRKLITAALEAEGEREGEDDRAAQEAKPESAGEEPTEE